MHLPGFRRPNDNTNRMTKASGVQANVAHVTRSSNHHVIDIILSRPRTDLKHVTFYTESVCTTGLSVWNAYDGWSNAIV